MFLRSTKRFKDGKAHRYWCLVENVRVGRRVFQRQTLYLGELNDSQQAQWQRAVEELIGPGALTGRSTLYNCLDHVIWPLNEWKKPRGERKNSFKDELFYYLRDRWACLFNSTCDVVLFDLTSTYFEVDGTKALDRQPHCYVTSLHRAEKGNHHPSRESRSEVAGATATQGVIRGRRSNANTGVVKT